MDNGIRLNKYIKNSGFCSRRKADTYIENGAVKINKKKASIGDTVKDGDKVYVNNTLIVQETEKVYIAFNKPVGITCTTDKKDKSNIIDYIKYPKRIFPIGRIDKDSEGLVLLTNDGDIVNRILRAGNAHEKEYIVTVNKKISENFIKDMRKGVKIHNTVTLPCKVNKINNNSFNIVLVQGLNRQIRLMCEELGYEVVVLKRVRIMNVTLNGIKSGSHRLLTHKEVGQLLKMTEKSSQTEDASKGKGSKLQNKNNPSVRRAKKQYSDIEKEHYRKKKLNSKAKKRK